MNARNAAEWRDKDDLPTATELHNLLHAGTSCSVNGHTLTVDEHGIWITNPYGNDRLWQDLTIGRVAQFLADMAVDKEYGPVP